jgi:hypothetical protein
MGLWGRKDEELPDVLKGKTPEQIAAALAAAEAAVNEIPGLKEKLTTRESEFGALQSTVTEAQARLQELETKLTSPKKTELAPTPDWGEDADAAFQDRMARTGLTQATLQNTAILNRLAAVQRINTDPIKAAILRKYQSEVDGVFNNCNPREKADPTCYDNVLNLVIGRHIGEINALTKDPGFMSPGGAPPPKAETESTDTLNETQKLVAKRFGISEEQYMAQLKRGRMSGLPKIA